MSKNETRTSDSASPPGKPVKTVLLSYRFADQSRFDVVQQIAVRLRFFSIEVVLDQRSLDYGEDIKEFMRREIRKADAIVLVITEDYNRALSPSSGPGEGVRFEVQAAIQEKTIRPSLQIIPLLLDGVRPVPPFDRMKCAVPEAIDEVITQLGLATVSGESRVLRQRYRVDRLVETRGVARIFHGWDMVADLPIEVYLVPAADQNLRYRFDLFERVVKGRSSAFSPFLLNIRDTHIDSEGGYYLITERFDGTDLDVPLARGGGTHPFGALCLAFQVCLALHELHSVGVIHGGLAPRCIRLNREQTSCKIVDFEFATPREFVTRPVGALEGYPQITPEPDQAWDHLINAQSTSALAIRVHDGFRHLEHRIRRLEVIEQLVFPPQVFVSTGTIIEILECSICGQEYEDCDHLAGRPYMGELCYLIVRDMDIDHVAFVERPADKRCRALGINVEGGTRNRMTWRIEPDEVST